MPAGLRNLGATCYVNTALQCLFSIPAFRSALLRATAGPPCPPRAASTGGTAVALLVGSDDGPEATSATSSTPSVPWTVDEVTGTLRDLFLDLKFGPAAHADPTAFAKSLQLEHGVQQVSRTLLKVYISDHPMKICVRMPFLLESKGRAAMCGCRRGGHASFS